jgi:hypothetical protein
MACTGLVASACASVHNMTTDPLRLLVFSAFWAQATPWVWPLAPLMVAVMAPADQQLGVWRIPARMLLPGVIHNGTATRTT